MAENQNTYTAKDYKSDQEVRWCPGCGDHAIMNAIQRERGKYITKDALRRLESFFDKMLAIKANKRGVRDEEEFENLFMEMSWANDILGGR